MIKESGKIKKITPDLWEIRYEVTKRRAGKAPVPIKFTYKDVEYKGEGVPVPGACSNGVC